MARPFTTKESHQLAKEYEAIVRGLEDVFALEQKYRAGIPDAAEQYLIRDIETILQNIPVEELNRDKRGIRTKLLKDAGFELIGDLMGVSVSKLEKISGIGKESAQNISCVMDRLVRETRRNIKIRLNYDNREPYATALVREISAYRSMQGEVLAATEFMQEHLMNIRSALVDLKQGNGFLKWLFAPASKKERIESAFFFLSDLLSGSFGEEAKNILDRVCAVKNMEDAQAWEDFRENSISFFTILEELVPEVSMGENPIYGLPEELAERIRNQQFFSDGLYCTLRKYQEWGVKYILHQKRVLLGDEMGLGKTIQAIAAMVSLKNEGNTHFVVVCPASVMSNWCREIEKHSCLKVVRIHGSGRENALENWLRDGGAAVTTYETAEHFRLSTSFRFAMCIVDEAHYIKNAKAQRTIHVKRICESAEYLLFMTGTALENRVDEMVELIRILRPEVAEEIQNMTFMAAAPVFREKVAPVYYRRRREDVLTELPELIEAKEWCTLSLKELLLYEKTVLYGSFADVRRVSWNVEDVQDSAKAERLLELVEEAKEDGRKVIVFSYFLDTIQKVCSLLSGQCMEPINGSVPPRKRQEIIDAFDKAPAGTVLAAQIQSGGTGLNIQSASVVILCEPQLKPSVENQAISRAYRMGQSRNVLVYRLLADDTIDEKITDLLAEKQAVFDAFADESAAGEATELLEIDEKTLGSIIKEEIERINEKYENRG